ncbi:MAG: hypothetical protein KF718_31520 [Polyangiaceae bacterium]|nr:hypothetical protein [Polyangiaceae bacterium]
MRRRCLRLTGFGLALSGVLFVGACSSEDAPAKASKCGDQTCGEYQRCDVSGQAPACVCVTGHTGVDCAECEAGYVLLGSACVPEPIDCDDNPCGSRGLCVSEPLGDRCQCFPAYTGPTCAQCAEGYQDNDEDGTCAEACGHPSSNVECEAPLVCDDSTGTAACGCPSGTTGASCELCLPGHARRGDGFCYQTCDHPDIDCGAPRHCFDDERREPARCVCPVGYAGSACGECAPDFSADSQGHCVRDAVGGFDLLTTGVVEGRRALVALDSSTGKSAPLRTIDSDIRGLARDPAAGTLYVSSGSQISTLDVASGATTLIAALGMGHGTPLGWRPLTGKLHSLRSGSPYTLVSVDPQTGTVEDVAPTGESWVWAMTHDPGADRLLVLRSQGSSPSVIAIDPVTGQATPAGDLAGMTALGASHSYGGLALLPGGALAVLAAAVLTEEQRRVAGCAYAAHRLGLDGYDTASGKSDYFYNGPQGTHVLAASGSGREIVGYESYTGPGTVLRIASQNPQAFICIRTYEETLTIEIASNAKFAGGVIYSYESGFLANVEGGYTPTSARIVAFGGSQANFSALTAHPQVFRSLTSAEVQDRLLGGFDLAPAAAPTRLFSFGLAGLTALGSVATPELRGTAGLTRL